MIPALPEVEAYRDRILAAIDRHAPIDTGYDGDVRAADRRRVERDVEGLRHHRANEGACGRCDLGSCPDALRYWTDLTEVGALYGQPWEDVPTIDLFLPPVGEVRP